MEVTSLFSQALPTFIAAGALYVSFRAYARQRSLENENHLFKYKIKQYTKIVHSISKVLELLYQSLLDIKLEQEILFPDKHIIDDVMGDIDKQMSRFRICLDKCTAFLPKHVVQELDNMYEAIFVLQEVVNTEDITKEQVTGALDQIGVLEDQLDSIVNLMRNDLGVESIDKRLKLRTG